MKGSLYLAGRYLAFHRVKTSVLIFSIALIFFVPAALQVLVNRTEQKMIARAEATPLLVGSRGSPVELVLNSLYFGADVPDPMPFSEVERIAETGLADPVPLYVRFRSQADPIVGTTLDYFTFRGLRLAEGRQLTRLGDCVVGARVAAARELAPGSAVISSPESVFDLAGVYPLKMRVTGVLAWSDGPDDDAIFVDLKTAWIIQGLAHGHEDLERPEARDRILKREGSTITANAALVNYNEITDANIDAFHFHGDTADFPITAIVPIPRDAKSATLLRGRYQSAEERQQILRPTSVLSELLETVLTVRSFVLAAMLLIGLSTLATTGLVFVLSRRMRRREIETLVKIGGSRAAVAAVLWLEIVIVLLAAAALAALLTWVAGGIGAEFLRTLVR
jgi:putative ABC transport system permease protein